MRRIMLLVTVVLVMAAMMAVAGPASAQAGCQGFGQFVVAAGAPHSGVTLFVPNVNDLVVFLKAETC